MRRNTFPRNISHTELKKAAEAMILSSSGFRKIFAAHEESSSTRINAPDMILLALIAESFAAYVQRNFPHSATISLGRDSRPTGSQMLMLLESIFVARNISTQNLDILPSPEISAYTAAHKEIHGFCYVSASHNPIGYNGIKFGAPDGSVLPPESVRELIAELQSRIAQYTEEVEFPPIVNSSSSKEWKKGAETAYWNFIKTQTLQDNPMSIDSLGLVVDMNGSARTQSIDLKWLRSLGLHVKAIHTDPGKIAHTILPEGDALQHAAKALKKAHKNDRRFLFAYVYDNDGDRGNILIYNRRAQKVISLSSQLHFALISMIELVWMECMHPKEKLAIVVNAPTSHRIDEIAKHFSVKVFRSEVGEANVLKKVRAVEKKGYQVCIAGEGSNGGCIILPGKIRDPLSAITSIVKLYAMNLFSLWCKRSGNVLGYSPNALLSDIIKALPTYTTSSMADERSQLRLQSTQIHRLKEEYERIFARDFPLKKKMLRVRLGITSWYQENYLEDVTIRGIAAWKELKSSSGGLSILFTNTKKEVLATIWFRKSGTEPIFRISVDLRGNDTLLMNMLLDWQRSMLHEADTHAQER